MDDKEVIISGVHVSLTDALRERVHKKMEKLFGHAGKIIRIHVSLEYIQNRSKDDEFVAQGEVEVNGPNIVARASSDDLYKSIDMMANKLDRQLVDKIKVDSERRKGATTAGAVRADDASTEII
jgi:putative sigma-54 modulation protein